MSVAVVTIGCGQPDEYSAREDNNAAAAAASLARSFGFSELGVTQFVTRSVLHRILCCSGASRTAAISQLPCLISPATSSQSTGESFSGVTASCAAAALSLVASFPPALRRHPLVAAAATLSSSVTRVGNQFTQFSLVSRF
jgi:hypothetical protein